MWKGADIHPRAELEAILAYPDGIMPLRHKITFTTLRQRFELIDEVVENEDRSSPSEKDVFFFYRYQEGRPVLSVREIDDKETAYSSGRRERNLRREDLAPDQSVLSQRRDPDQYPEITYLGGKYRQFKLYREWNMGRNTAPRNPQPVDQPNDFLAEDASNLGLVLNSLERTGSVKDSLDSHFSKFYDQYRDYSASIEGGTVQLFLRENSLGHAVPATRLSDGTLRFMCLASVLCHPSPPPLMCIEEPEIGLHPDILPLVAEMLTEASQRTQIVVTTHSDILVAALTLIPEAVLVCEKESNATSVRRLDPDRLREWLEDYTLGDLWLSGELGGNRW